MVIINIIYQYSMFFDSFRENMIKNNIFEKKKNYKKIQKNCFYLLYNFFLACYNMRVIKRKAQCFRWLLKLLIIFPLIIYGSGMEPQGSVPDSFFIFRV